VKEKTVVRGGFRIAYDPTFYNIHLNVASSAPFVNAGTIAAGTTDYQPWILQRGCREKLVCRTSRRKPRPW